MRHAGSLYRGLFLAALAFATVSFAAAPCEVSLAKTSNIDDALQEYVDASAPASYRKGSYLMKKTRAAFERRAEPANEPKTASVTPSR